MKQKYFYVEYVAENKYNRERGFDTFQVCKIFKTFEKADEYARRCADNRNLYNISVIQSGGLLDIQLARYNEKSWKEIKQIFADKLRAGV